MNDAPRAVKFIVGCFSWKNTYSVCGLGVDTGKGIFRFGNFPQLTWPVFPLQVSENVVAIATRNHETRTGDIFLADVSTRELALSSRLVGHTLSSRALCLVNDTLMHRPLLASASWDGSVRLWDISQRTCLATLKNEDSETLNYLDAVAYVSSQPRFIFAGCRSGHVSSWDLETKKPVDRWLRHDSWVMCLCHDSERGLLFSAERNGKIRAVDIRTREKVIWRIAVRGQTDSICFRTQQQQLVVPTNKGVIHIYDTRSRKVSETSGKVLHQWKGHARGHPIWRCCDCPIENLIVTASADNSVRLWCGDSFRLVWRFRVSFGVGCVGPMFHAENLLSANESLVGLDQRLSFLKLIVGVEGSGCGRVSRVISGGFSDGFLFPSSLVCLRLERVEG